MSESIKAINPDDVAIIGMSCRLPQAENVEEFWKNLVESRECITFYTDEELEKAGVPRERYEAPGYVKASGAIEDIEYFDAKFFEFSPKEASLIDPQQRVFLEQAYKALEDAGLNPDAYRGAVGVYASAGMNTYLYHNLGTHEELMEEGGGYPVMISSDKDFLATRVSYKLNLKGPSMTIQTACSSSLVAVHCACEALRSGECDCALAGGVSIRVPQKAGYLYQEGLILSPDGHCRAFDEKSQGTVFGNGAGVIVLKMLEDALEDGDEIYAVIKGSAINNDGSVKAGYTAPGMEAQAAVIYEALNVAGVSPKEISYVETHGTGTSIGDPIEIAALTRAYKEDGIEPGSCAIGSVKTNIGHLDTASGVAGVIKTALALKNRQLPASLNYDRPNPKIDFVHSPFYVNTALSEWKSDTPRRAGVSSFGIGGTNAHVILEEAPERSRGKEGIEASGRTDRQVLILSAKSAGALDRRAEDMARFLRTDTESGLPDICYTAACCRKQMSHRMALVCSSKEEAAQILSDPDRHTVFRDIREKGGKGIAFLFPGQGSQHVNMGLELYREEPFFRETMDECFRIVEPLLGADLKRLIYPEPGGEEAAAEQLKNTLYTQPALFLIEYSLGRLLMHWGAEPKAMAGHSLGEYAAACLAGVFTLEEALGLVVTRAKLISGLPGGSMLSVQLGEKELLPYLGDGTGVSIAALNGENNAVLSGTKEAVSLVQDKLEADGVVVKELATSHAFHSAMLDPILPEFKEAVEKMKRKTPQIPYVSTCTGKWQSEEDVLSPDYWVSHLRNTVRFYDAASRLLEDKELTLIEVGPGKALSSLIRRHPCRDGGQTVVNCLPHQKESAGAGQVIMEALARLWTAGAEIDWGRFFGEERRRKVRIPTYPFDKKKCWVEPAGKQGRKTGGHYYRPVYERTEHEYEQAAPEGCLIFRGEETLGELLAAALSEQGGVVAQVRDGGSYCRKENGKMEFTLPMSQPDAYGQLLEEIAGQEVYFGHIIYLRGLQEKVDEAELFKDLAALFGFLDKAAAGRSVRVTAVVRGAVDISGCEAVNDNMQALAGLAQAMQTAMQPAMPSAMQTAWGKAGLQLIDIGPEADAEMLPDLTKRLCREIAGDKADAIVAFRGRARWRLTYESLTLPKSAGSRKEGQELSYLYLQESAVPGCTGWQLEDAGGGKMDGPEGEKLDLTDSSAVLRMKNRLEEAGCRLGGILYRPEGTLCGRMNTLADFDAARYKENIMRLRGELRNLQDILGDASSGFLAVIGGENGPSLENCWLKGNVSRRGRQGGCPWVFLDCISPEVPVRPLLPLLENDGRAALMETIFLAEEAPRACMEGAREEDGEDRAGGDAAADRTDLNSPYAAPVTPTEKVLVKIWERILGAAPIGIHDNFFELGGTSLMMTQILSGIRKELGEQPLNVKNIYDNQTVYKLAGYLDAVGGTGTDLSEGDAVAAYEVGEL